jgi:uncharacterized protein (TIGR02246 family)
MGDNDATAVRTALRTWCEAIVSNDADRISPLMTEHWIIVTPVGEIAARQFLDAIRSAALRHTAMHPATGGDGESRIRIYGDVAVLTQRTLSTEIQGDHVRDNDEWITTVLTRRDDVWLIDLMQVTPVADKTA